MRRNSNYLYLLSDEFQEIATEAGIEKKYVEYVFDIYLKHIRAYMDDPRVPEIYVHKFLRFIPSSGYARRLIREGFKSFRRGNNVRELLYWRVARYWDVRNRLIKQEDRLKEGEEIYNEWAAKNPKEYAEDLEKEYGNFRKYYQRGHNKERAIRYYCKKGLTERPKDEDFEKGENIFVRRIRY
jgi:hypothetical protein